MRKIIELEFAEPLLEQPRCVPRNRLRGNKAAGMRYERAVGAELRAELGSARWLIYSGRWFRFRDANGWGYCQPDFIISHLDVGLIIVLECKLTEKPEADAQLNGLYLPVLRKLYDGNVYGIVVAKNLTRNTNISRVHDGLESAIAAAIADSNPIWHYLG